LPSSFRPLAALPARTVFLLTLAVLVGLGGWLATSSSRGQSAQQPLSNGGAKQWVAFDPLVSNAATHQSLNMVRIVRLVNTSNATNSFTVTYERPGNPTRLPICSGTLVAGEARTCSNVNKAATGYVDGYLLVRASQPVIAGGYIDLPVQDYEQAGSGSNTRLKFLNRGTVQRLSYDWQPGCPPRQGNGCPTTQSTLTPAAG
jgi:hypothetical protein